MADRVERELQPADGVDTGGAAAVHAAVAVAREHGLRAEKPVVLRDFTNVIVRLDPVPLVARVPMTLSRLRRPEWFALEVRVVAWLAGRGAPVAPPATVVDPGPHERDGFLVSFWEVAESDDRRFDAAAAGRTLRELHLELGSCREELPPFHRLEEIGRLLDLLQPSELASAEELAGMRQVREILAERPLPPLQPLHGDAHLRNVLWTATGPLWTDFENLCAGPLEYDLACISWRGRSEDAAALDEYGAHDEALRTEMEPYLALFLAPWTLTIAARHPTAAAVAEARRRVRRALEPLQALEM